jgi:MFS transporter, ACS family, D-galactonate transporter
MLPQTRGAMMNERRTTAGGWAIVALLFLFMLINFADKAVVGLASVPIMQELHLGPRQFGLLGSGFFLLYPLSAILVGFAVNRVRARWALLGMGFVWALTQFPMVGSVGFAALLACRMALGAGEGPAYPVALHATYKWFPNEARTLPTAIVSQGAGVGILLGLPALNWVVVHYSWHWAFGTLGIAGLAWTALWLAFGREGSLADTADGDADAGSVRLPYGRLLRNPTIVASWCAGFGAYWGLSLALTWQGAFLIKGLGFVQGKIGLLAALPAGVTVVVVIAGGWLSQRLLARGATSRSARGILGGGFVMAGGVALLLMPALPTVGQKIAMTTLGIALPSVIYVIGPAIVAEITPLAQRGALLAIGTAITTTAGILSPFVMGSVIQGAATPLAGFNTGYQLCGAIMLLGGLIGAALMNPERETERLATGSALARLGRELAD